MALSPAPAPIAVIPGTGGRKWLFTGECDSATRPTGLWDILLGGKYLTDVLIKTGIDEYFLAVDQSDTGSGGAAVVAVRNARDGAVIEIIGGDSYTGTDISWTGETEDQWGDLASAVLTFGLKYGSTSLQKTAVVDSATGTQSFSVQITAEESAALPPTQVGRYDVQAEYPSGVIKTLVGDKCVVLKSWSD